MSLNNRLKCNILNKADDISTDEANKIRIKNKIMIEQQGNFKTSKNEKKINKNFLRKQIIKENNDLKNDQEEEECLLDDFSKNYVFQYYYSTIEYMKKYYNNMDFDYYNNSKNNNALNINNYYSYEKNIYNISYIKTSNINKNNKMNNNILVNDCQDKKINFIINNCKNENDKNKKSECCNNLEKEDTKKINSFSKEEITIHNLNSNFEKDNKSNINGFQNLIININCPSFKPSNYNNKENISIKSQSDAIPNKVENKNKGKENVFPEEEYSTQMFGKKGWICVLCNNFNFETRIMCNRCKALKNPKKIVNAKYKIKDEINQNNEGENYDWICSKCQNFNYSFRTICNRCKAPKIYQIVVKPILYQNIIYNNIIRYSRILTPSYFIINHMPNTNSNKIV
jgi:hypothetical protein